MPRITEAHIIERINAGDSDLLDFIPESAPNHDTYTTLFLVGRRRRDSQGIHTRNSHAQHRSDGPQGILLPSDPNYVVSIKIPGWAYEQDSTRRAIERVFRVEGQRMTLDITQTVAYMRPNLSDREEVADIIDGLEAEVDFDNYQNQRILQEMFKRVQEGEPMILSRPSFVPYNGAKKDPRKRYLPVQNITIIPDIED